MIVYIVLDGYEKYKSSLFLEHKLLFEKLSGEKCLMAHFTDLREGEIEALAPSAIIYSGGTVDFEDNDDVLNNTALRQLMMNWPGPQLAICYSFQLVAAYYGGEVAEIGPVGPQDIDANPTYCPGTKKEYGVYPVLLISDSPLFEGFGETIQVAQNHRLEVKKRPEGFIPLAESELCRYQAFQIAGRPFFATQFHPERLEALNAFPDGENLIKNFFNIARDFNAKL